MRPLTAATSIRAVMEAVTEEAIRRSKNSIENNLNDSACHPWLAESQRYCRVAAITSTTDCVLIHEFTRRRSIPISRSLRIDDSMTILSPRWLHRIHDSNETVSLCLFQWDWRCWCSSCLARRINAAFFATMSQYPTRIMNPRLRVRYSTSSDFSFLYARWVTVAIKFARLYVIYRMRAGGERNHLVQRHVAGAEDACDFLCRLHRPHQRTLRSLFSELIELAFAIRVCHWRNTFSFLFREE